jgi:hypothetical protein
MAYVVVIKNNFLELKYIGTKYAVITTGDKDTILWGAKQL